MNRMGRILAIDYGRKRVGLAVTDTLQIAPHGLTTVRACDALDFVCSYIAREDVEKVIVGLPRQMSGEYSESMTYIKPFVKKLESRIQVPIEFVDERFTSLLAHNAMIYAGAKRKTRQNKALVDEISATIILQTYMESKQTTQSAVEGQ